MQITITINTDNAAFEDNAETEVARTLANSARNLADGLTTIILGATKLRDINGNTVGAVEIKH